MSNISRSIQFLGLGAFFAFVSRPECADACAVCMGASDAKIAPAINAAMFLMLGFIGLMFAGIGAVALGIARRAKCQDRMPDLSAIEL